jgi:hypothetical protein
MAQYRQDYPEAGTFDRYAVPEANLAAEFDGDSHWCRLSPGTRTRRSVLMRQLQFRSTPGRTVARHYLDNATQRLSRRRPDRALLSKG